jgi:hypothetical protein
VEVDVAPWKSTTERVPTSRARRVIEVMITVAIWVALGIILHLSTSNLLRSGGGPYNINPNQPLLTRACVKNGITPHHP